MFNRSIFDEFERSFSRRSRRNDIFEIFENDPFFRDSALRLNSPFIVSTDIGELLLVFDLIF